MQIIHCVWEFTIKFFETSDVVSARKMQSGRRELSKHHSLID
jgi:hypothetical protein